jgi:hypothetical protein
VRWAPGIPHALYRAEDFAKLGPIVPRDREVASAIGYLKIESGYKIHVVPAKQTSRDP